MIENQYEDRELRQALHVILDYLTDSLASALMSSFDIAQETLSSSSSVHKRKADWETALEVSE